MDVSLIYIVIALIFGLIGISMADKRHRSKFGGFCLGTFLSLFGLIILAFMGDKNKKKD